MEKTERKNGVSEGEARERDKGYPLLFEFYRRQKTGELKNELENELKNTLQRLKIKEKEGKKNIEVSIERIEKLVQIPEKEIKGLSWKTSLIGLRWAGDFLRAALKEQTEKSSEVSEKEEKELLGQMKNLIIKIGIPLVENIMKEISSARGKKMIEMEEEINEAWNKGNLLKEAGSIISWISNLSELIEEVKKAKSEIFSTQTDWKEVEKEAIKDIKDILEGRGGQVEK